MRNGGVIHDPAWPCAPSPLPVIRGRGSQIHVAAHTRYTSSPGVSILLSLHGISAGGSCLSCPRAETPAPWWHLHSSCAPFILGHPLVTEKCHSGGGVWLSTQHLLRCWKEPPEALQCWCPLSGEIQRSHLAGDNILSWFLQAVLDANLHLWLCGLALAGCAWWPRF